MRGKDDTYKATASGLKRFVLAVGCVQDALEAVCPNYGHQQNIDPSAILIWDVQEDLMAAYFPGRYAQTICLETQTSSGISHMESWFNDIDNKCFTAETQIAPTDWTKLKPKLERLEKLLG